MAERKVGRFRRAWRNTGLSGPKVVGAALAAIAMAMIAPRITSVTNSLIAVGLISTLTAVLTAVMSSAAAVTAESAKQLGLTGHVPVVRDGGDDAGDGGGGAGGAGGAGDADGGGASGKHAAEGKHAASGTGDGAASKDSASGVVHDADGDQPVPTGPTLWHRLVHSNYVYLVLFIVISVVTIWISLGVARATGDVHYYGGNTTVTSEVSDAAREEIVQEAVAATLAQLGVTEQATDPATGEVAEPVTLATLQAVYEEVQERLAALEETESDDELSLAEQIAALEEKVAELEALLEEYGFSGPGEGEDVTDSPAPAEVTPPGTSTDETIPDGTP